MLIANTNYILAFAELKVKVQVCLVLPHNGWMRDLVSIAVTVSQCREIDDRLQK